MTQDTASESAPAQATRVPPSDVTVRDLRLSYLWTQALAWPAFVEPERHSLAQAKAEGVYVTAFQAARSSGSVMGQPLERPWRPGQRHHFWRYYLREYVKGQPLDALSPRRAYRALVPFRFAVPVFVTSPLIDHRCQVEAFVHPHAVTLVLTARIRRQASLDQHVDNVQRISGTPCLELRWTKSSPPIALGLEELANRLLPSLLRRFYGARATAGRRTLQPFEIVTIIQGKGPVAGQELMEGSPLHLALEGFLSGDPEWRNGQPRLVSEADLGVRKTSPAGYTLYGSPRGRVVWFPARFTAQERTHALSCYHRNLTLLSTMIESLSYFAAEAAGPVTQSGFDSMNDRDYAHFVAGILGRLNGGVDDIYQSRSARYHIARSGLKDEIDTLRELCTMSPLT